MKVFYTQRFVTNRSVLIFMSHLLILLFFFFLGRLFIEREARTRGARTLPSAGGKRHGEIGPRHPTGIY